MEIKIRYDQLLALQRAGRASSLEQKITISTSKIRDSFRMTIIWAVFETARTKNFLPRETVRLLKYTLRSHANLAQLAQIWHSENPFIR